MPLKSRSFKFSQSPLSFFQIFKKFIYYYYYYYFERQREPQHAQQRGRERGRHRIQSRLQALSCQHRAQRGGGGGALELTNCEMVTWAEAGHLTDWAIQEPLPFSFISFIIWGFAFRSMIHLELIAVHAVRYGSKFVLFVCFFFLHMLVQLFKYRLLKSISFLH